ncbi:UPF0415 protein C7orf25 homolog isoform X2 [Ptychodera flava]|uniref:UPF0415 protein C7orf25 homolog isoform X2 n=1 Tax=Ptychodera flava TaxID=63121 RepID=UPI003969C1D5
MSVVGNEMKKALLRADGLLSRSKEIHVEGAPKLRKKVSAELKFLETLRSASLEKQESRLKSSNLSHLEAIIDIAEKYPNVTHLLRPFHYTSEGGQAATVVVDIVAGNGKLWVKVIARKASALHRVWLGDGDYGDKSVVDQARQYISASQQYLVHFQPPIIEFAFYGGITQPIADELRELGVVVKGNIIDMDAESQASSQAHHLSEGTERGDGVPSYPVQCSETSIMDVKDCDKLNLDITCLISLVSELTHGGCWYQFQEKVLTDQAVQERECPLLPRLHDFIAGKRLFACETAVKDFKSILSTLGGPNERARADRLLSNVTVVADNVSERVNRLKESGRIKSRSKIIFGSGDSIKAITVTANLHFVRASEDQGVPFAVFLHDPRALTESKQSTAIKIEKCSELNQS